MELNFDNNYTTGGIFRRFLKNISTLNLNNKGQYDRWQVLAQFITTPSKKFSTK